MYPNPDPTLEKKSVLDPTYFRPIVFDIKVNIIDHIIGIYQGVVVDPVEPDPTFTKIAGSGAEPRNEPGFNRIRICNTVFRAVARVVEPDSTL